MGEPLRLAVIGALTALALGGCTPEAPGFVVVGRGDDGGLIGGVLVCGNAPDRAILTPTAMLETDAEPDAEWHLDHRLLPSNKLVTWPLFGPTSDAAVKSTKQAEDFADERMSLYVQRDPESGAAGIDFSTRDLKALQPAQYLYRDDRGQAKQGTEANVVAASTC